MNVKVFYNPKIRFDIGGGIKFIDKTKKKVELITYKNYLSLVI